MRSNLQAILHTVVTIALLAAYVYNGSEALLGVLVGYLGGAAGNAATATAKPV